MYQRLTARQRFRRRRDFVTVRGTGKRMECGPFGIFVKAFPNPSGQAPLRRLGVIASRRVGGAVKRNRAKRIFREVFRQNQELLPRKVDILLVARRGVDQYSYRDILIRYIGAYRRLEPQLLEES